MSSNPCQVCQRPTPDSFLCADCTRKIEQWLGDFPAMVDELETTMAKLDRISRGEHGGKPGKRSDAPLVYSVAASETLWEVANTLSSWARHIYEARGLNAPQMPRDLLARVPSAATAIHASRLLLGSRKAIPGDEAAGEVYDEVRYAYHAAIRAVDVPEQRVYVGKCGAPLMFEVADEDGVLRFAPLDEFCEAELYARVTADHITCAECGASFDRADREAELKQKLADRWAPLDEIAAGLSQLSEPVTKRRLDVWVKKDRVTARLLADRGFRWESAGRPFLIARSKDEDGRLLYRVGDVLDRIAFAQTYERSTA